MAQKMSKWYPLEGYSYADETAATSIAKIEDKIRKVMKSDLDDAIKKVEVKNLYEAIMELCFEHEVCYERVIDYIDWLYDSNELEAALDLAMKLFQTLKDMVNPNTYALGLICNRLEELAYECGADSDELMDDILFTRVHHDV